MGKTNPHITPVFQAWTDTKLLQREQDEMKYGGFGKGRLLKQAEEETIEEKEESMKKMEGGEGDNEQKVNTNDKIN